MINLVVNARDAMPEGGSVKIRTSNVEEAVAATYNYRGMPAADYVLIEVEDSGTGIPQEVLEKKSLSRSLPLRTLAKVQGLGFQLFMAL